MHKKVVLVLLLSLRCILFLFCFDIPNERRMRQYNTAVDYMSIADGFYELKKFDKAAEYYQKALISDVCYDTALYKAACSFALGRQWENALECYDELLQKDPGNRTIRESIAYVDIMSGQIEEGKNIYLQLVKEFPEDANLKKNYMLTLLSIDEMDNVKKELELYITKFGKDKNSEIIQNSINKKEKKGIEELPVSKNITSATEKNDKTEVEKIERERKPIEKVPEEKSYVDDEYSIPDWTE